MMRRLILPVVFAASILLSAAPAQTLNATIRGNAAFTAVQERGIEAPWSLGFGLGVGLPGLPLELRATFDWYLAGPAYLISANALYTFLPLQIVDVYAMGGFSGLLNPDFAPATSELFFNLGAGARVNLGPAFVFGELALYLNGALELYGAPLTFTVGAGLIF